MNIISESIPIYARIAEGIKDRILSGDFKEGEQLPSTTQISREFDINISTVNRAVNVLVSEGVAFKKRGIGMFVADGAVERLIDERRKMFRENYIQATLVEAKRLRYSVEDLQTMVAEIYKKIS